MNVDLHCHSTASDGLLRPEELVARAAANGVEMLALTDHDDLSRLARARAEAESRGMRFVDGVEISVTLKDTTVPKIYPLSQPDPPPIRWRAQASGEGRARRAERIGD